MKRQLDETSQSPKIPVLQDGEDVKVPASRDTVLRTVRRRAIRPVERPSVIGIDDGAFRRGKRYGTLACDLERRRVITLLPDLESGTVEAWLAAHPEITVVARDSGGCYGEATTRSLPKAIQVTDQWHLIGTP